VKALGKKKGGVPARENHQEKSGEGENSSDTGKEGKPNLLFQSEETLKGPPDTSAEARKKRGSLYEEGGGWAKTLDYYQILRGFHGRGSDSTLSQKNGKRERDWKRATREEHREGRSFKIVRGLKKRATLVKAPNDRESVLTLKFALAGNRHWKHWVGEKIPRPGEKGKTNMDCEIENPGAAATLRLSGDKPSKGAKVRRTNPSK